MTLRKRCANGQVDYLRVPHKLIGGLLRLIVEPAHELIED
jgi:hypothetical protein